MPVKPEAAILRASGITKSFGPTRALRGANLILYPGEVHALVGENGAGKSTLVKILAGALGPDNGRLIFKGNPLRLSSVREAVKQGIVPIYQQLSLMPDLSVAENIFAFDLTAGAAWDLVASSNWIARSMTALAQVGLRVDPRALVGELSLAERQLVEIARGVIRDSDALILDEPTASLNRAEVERLFAVVHSLCERGRAVLFITHRLDEVDEIADRVSVLRDGAMVLESLHRADVSSRAIVEAMIGRVLDHDRLLLPDVGVEVLKVAGFTSPGKFVDFCLTVRAGEIVGIVGLIGSGALEVGAAIAGAFPVRRGSLSVQGRPVRIGDRTSSQQAGIGFIPVDRERDGVFPTMSVLANGSASILYELAPFGWLRLEEERNRILPGLRLLAVKPADPKVNIQALSGGNQQKVLVVRNLASTQVKAIVALEPTRGVDVGVRREIRRALMVAASGGLGIVVVSSEMEEVLAISHRIIVMRDGRIVAEIPAPVDPSVILGHLGAGAV